MFMEVLPDKTTAFSYDPAVRGRRVAALRVQPMPAGRTERPPYGVISRRGREKVKRNSYRQVSYFCGAIPTLADMRPSGLSYRRNCVPRDGRQAFRSRPLWFFPLRAGPFRAPASLACERGRRLHHATRASPTDARGLLDAPAAGRAALPGGSFTGPDAAMRCPLSDACGAVPIVPVPEGGQRDRYCSF